MSMSGGSEAQPREVARPQSPRRESPVMLNVALHAFEDGACLSAAGVT
jgi:hypothetical protein